MQIDRLIQIVFLLLSRNNLTAKQLAEELGVSTRTIYRDINILSVAGIPITSQKGYGGGLSLLQGFSLDKSYFTQAEQSNMIQALQILKSSNYPDADKTLNKVAGLFSHNMQSEWLEIDFSYWGSPEKERVNITALERAIINKYVITFTYFNTELTVTAQTVEPLKLVFKSRPQMAQGRDSGASLVPHVFPCFSRLDYQFSQTNAGGKDIHLGSAFCSSFHGFSVFSSDFRSDSVRFYCFYWWNDIFYLSHRVYAANT